MLRHNLLTSILLTWAFSLATAAVARPQAARLVCEAWADVPACYAEQRQGTINCSFCHTEKVPERNPFGVAFKQWLSVNHPEGYFPSKPEEMADALDGIAGLDSDADGITNGNEIRSGTPPGIDAQVNSACGSQSCVYDHDYAYTRIRLSVCGEPPDFDDFETFQRLPTTLAKDEALERLLDDCMDSNAWRGKDGVIWEIGHYKIRPIGNLKLGDDKPKRGGVPAVDYYRDYNIFVYSQIDDNDARDMLLLQDAVIRVDGTTETTYTKQAETKRLEEKMVMQREYRVGLLTSFWNLAVYLNYTGIARVLVAQTFNAFLGISLAEMQGLEYELPAEVTKFKDYDGKLSAMGEDGKPQIREECARCHRSIDPLAYPFRNYNGLTGTTNITNGENADLIKDTSRLGDKESLTPLSYSVARMDFLNRRYPGIKEMPETGYIFGQKVNNLREWATVLVNSDPFASNLVKDYWSAVLGHDPDPRDPEFVMLWQKLKDTSEQGYNYRVSKMMHGMIKTMAFGGRPIAQP